MPSLIHKLYFDEEKWSSYYATNTVCYIFEPNKKVPLEQYIPKISSLNQSWMDLWDRSWYHSFVPFVNPFELYPNSLNYDKWNIWYYVFCNKSLSKRVLFWVELDLLKSSSLESRVLIKGDARLNYKINFDKLFWLVRFGSNENSPSENVLIQQNMILRKIVRNS